MSSDSEDDCYGNIAQKLQSIKNKYKETEAKIETNNLLSSTSGSKQVDKIIEIDDNSGKYISKIGATTNKNDCEVSKNDSDGEDISLDDIIAKNSKKRATRSKRSAVTADISADNILPNRRRKQSKTLKASDTSESLPSNPNTSDRSVTSVDTLPNVPVSEPNSVNTRGRGSRRQSRRRGGNTVNSRASNVDVNPTNTTVPSTVSTTVTNTVSTAEITTNVNNSSLQSRGSHRGVGGRQRDSPWSRRRRHIPDYFSQFGFEDFGGPSAPSHQIQTSYPTYSVGNTFEYPDESYNQPLFTKQNTKTDDVVVVGEEQENDSIDENEELSVKVYWQNCEYVKFTICRFQNLTQIFDFFANRENISHDKLFFTYNDKILKIDDTPDSITYSIVKFIDGGIINQSVSKIIQKDRSTVKDGIKLKFQCQNVKKPFETTIRLDDKMSVAMMMCAEHLEKPLDKLKFHFDGDLITGKNTPRDLELEGGECIDVKISS